jgi:hypothetical protein
MMLKVTDLYILVASMKITNLYGQRALAERGYEMLDPQCL